MSVILLIIAATMNAVMDVLENDFEGSVFGELNPMWWNPRFSWHNKHRVKNRFLKQLYTPFSDAWHTSKSIMVLCIGLAVSLEYGVLYYLLFSLIFEIFYNCILRRDECLMK